jgi:large subunit ribosomal protein L10
VNLAISKARKRELVAAYRDMLGRNSGMILANLSGVSVARVDGLRRKIREAGGEFHIVKNNLVWLAFQEVGLEFPEDALDGPTAIGFGSEELPAIAKAIIDLAKEAETVSVKAGWIDGVVYSGLQIERLADLPPLAVVQAQLLGVLTAPASRLVGSLAASVRQVVNVMNAYSESEPSAA